MRLCRESYNKPARVLIYIVFGTALEVRRSFFVCVKGGTKKTSSDYDEKINIRGGQALCI